MSESNSQKVLKGVSSQTLVTLVLGVVEIISFSIMSRLLTQEDFGYYAAITAITTIFASFADTGIGSAVVQRKNLTKRYIDNAFTLSLIFGLVVSLALVIMSGPLSRAVLDDSMKVPLMLIASTLLFNCLASVNFSLLQRRLQFLRSGLITLISLVVTTVVAIILAYKGFGYYAILVKSILSSFISLVLSYIFVHTRYSIALDKDTFKSIFGFSGWLMASGFFRNFAQQIDRLMMGKLLSVSALGTYNRPKEFINQISTKLNGIFDTALFPVLSGIQDNKLSIGRAYISSIYYMNMFAMVLAVGFVFNSELIIRIFLGTQWLSVQPIFIILSTALIFSIDGRLADCYFRSLGLTKQQFYFRIIELAVRVVALIIGVYWELIGVAISLVLANLIMIVVKTVYIASRINVTAKETFRIMFQSWRFSLFMLPILLICIWLLPHTVVGNIVMVFVYGILLLIVFLFVPSIAGTRYKNEVYNRLISLIVTKLRIRR